MEVEDEHERFYQKVDAEHEGYFGGEGYRRSHCSTSGSPQRVGSHRRSGG